MENLSDKLICSRLNLDILLYAARLDALQSFLARLGHYDENGDLVQPFWSYDVQVALHETMQEEYFGVECFVSKMKIDE